MRHVRFSVLSLAALSLAAVSFASLSQATIITCSTASPYFDDGLTYSDSCPSDPTNGRCIVPAGQNGGCCNKGTCNGSVCNVGGPIDAPCLNDGNDCTDDFCTRQGNNQGICAHQPSSSSKDCNLDGDVCTLDKCNGSTTSPACLATGNINTCAAEQAADAAEQPICAPWKCNATTGCAKTAVANSPPVVCDDGKDCTSGDICINGVCGKGPSGSFVRNGYPCRDDDTHLGNGDNRTWCRAGTCDGESEACHNVSNVPDGGACDPNLCTTAHCIGSGASGVCHIDSCNTSDTVFCEPCGLTFQCVNYGVGENANFKNACGCLSLY